MPVASSTLTRYLAASRTAPPPLGTPLAGPPLCQVPPRPRPPPQRLPDANAVRRRRHLAPSSFRLAGPPQASPHRSPAPGVSSHAPLPPIPPRPKTSWLLPLAPHARHRAYLRLRSLTRCTPPPAPSCCRPRSTLLPDPSTPARPPTHPSAAGIGRPAIPVVALCPACAMGMASAGPVRCLGASLISV
nr:pistil-specific extensin-like protein [Aegilops tauschii subsp. strangulata]